jgi:hypothetical protein
MLLDRNKYRRVCYAQPERLRPVPLDNGRVVWEREPGSPTREARPYELNSWWEEVPEDVRTQG